MKAALTSIYPADSTERDEWVLSQRPARESRDPRRPNSFLVEQECSAEGEIVPVATLFLTNRECPWRCVMCDLWRKTLTEAIPTGAIPEQIDYALARLPEARQIKLYNSGSFFDRRAIPVEDYPAIAERVSQFERTIVESHPALVGDRTLRFRDLISGQLEVAMGLETAHPEVLKRLNKRMTLDQFAAAADLLRASEIALRVFIIVQPPFMQAAESLYWAERSLDFAFDCGATAATLIPARAGNGAMERLQQNAEFTPPSLEVVEAAVNYGLSVQRGRVFVDLWDMCSTSGKCLRIERLHEMNLMQRVLDTVQCPHCKDRC